MTQRIGVSVDTNAHYTAYQKNPTDEWSQINFDNEFFKLETLSFTVEEATDPYAVVFVCPSKRRDVPHKVYLYYATAAEMTLLDFRCKKPPADILQSPIYGTIGGVNLATLSSPRGEIVHVAVSSTKSLNVLEAYAAEVPVGKRDVVAMKGLQSLNGNFMEEAKVFSILRGKLSLSEKSQEVNIGFGRAYDGYTADFDPGKLSSVSITGSNAGDNILVELGFLSINKSLLNLVSTNQTSFNFLPVPLDEFTSADIGGFFNSNEFRPGEGHELSATIETLDGKIDREVRKFFTLSDAEHELNLPKSIDFTPTLSLNNNGAFQIITTNWPEYNDAASGKTQLYRWIFDGTATKLTGENLPDVEVTKVQWLVHATPGWVDQNSRTVGNFSLTLPEKIDSVATSEGKPVEVWSNDWSFQSNTPVDWELTAYATDEKGSSEAVVEYLLNRNIIENYRFSAAHMRSSISPSP